MIELSSENFYCTGIRTDVVQVRRILGFFLIFSYYSSLFIQQAVVIPTFVEHLRFHISLKFLEDKIGYTFKNRLLLQVKRFLSNWLTKNFFKLISFSLISMHLHIRLVLFYFIRTLVAIRITYVIHYTIAVLVTQITAI